MVSGIPEPLRLYSDDFARNAWSDEIDTIRHRLMDDLRVKVAAAGWDLDAVDVTLEVVEDGPLSTHVRLVAEARRR